VGGTWATVLGRWLDCPSELLRRQHPLQLGGEVLPPQVAFQEWANYPKNPGDCLPLFLGMYDYGRYMVR